MASHTYNFFKLPKWRDQIYERRFAVLTAGDISIKCTLLKKKKPSKIYSAWPYADAVCSRGALRHEDVGMARIYAWLKL